MCINAFNILDDNLNTIGTGIYLAASILNHSCIPNAAATFDGITLRIGAVVDIEHTDPELVIIHYKIIYFFFYILRIIFFLAYIHIIFGTHANH